MSKEKFSVDMPIKERHSQLVEMADEDIDYSDIPPLDEEFWKNAEIKRPEKKEGYLYQTHPSNP